MQCPRCHTHLPDNAKFCLECGYAFAAPPPSIANTGSGAAASTSGVAAGEGGVAAGKITGNVTVNNYPPGAQPPAPLTDQYLEHYLDYLIETHRHLRLQGIRAGSQPLSVELENVYVSLKAVEKGGGPEEGDKAGVRETPGELTVAGALQRRRRLVVIGDPGCGKTTLLAYLALTYARSWREGPDLVGERLQLDEKGRLPVLLPLRDFGRHLKEKQPQAALDGPALLLNYLREYYANQAIVLPEDFFARPLDEGGAVVLLDGMDELADPALRRRVARLLEKFVARYPGNRYVVTSRVVGYEGAARLGAEFGLAQVRDFNRDEVRQFVRDWTLAVELTLRGDSETVRREAAAQAERLAGAVEHNPRVAELAVNPLLLTVIALVHRYRAQLPERRSELYEEAVEVLLGQWDEAKGLAPTAEVAGRALDAGDRRSLLEPVAFWMHERQRREIELDELRRALQPSFVGLTGQDKRQAEKALEAFVRLINERSGLLVERGAGVYGFAHLTFQEYLAARALADRPDAVDYTLTKLAEPWWREAILLEAGYLSTQGRSRVSDLVRAIMEASCPEPEPCHHLLLAAECLADAGAARVEGDLPGEVTRRLRAIAESAPPAKAKSEARRAAILRKVAAMNALSRMEGTGGAGPASLPLRQQFWKAPWGEPDWAPIPAGEFWMGSERGDSDEKPLHRVYVAEFQIARAPVTNAQYALFVKDAGYGAPGDWPGGQPPRGKDNHPVVNVTWHDAQAYCRWLGEKLGRGVRLPTEAEWEKAARGAPPIPAAGGGEPEGAREYPWGDEWKELHCNSSELGLGETSPVGLFLNGASPYGVLDMAGNVWEWCQSKNQPYPYQAEDGREIMDQSGSPRVVRGGSFADSRRSVRGAYRVRYDPDDGSVDWGFRCVLSPL